MLKIRRSHRNEVDADQVNDNSNNVDELTKMNYYEPKAGGLPISQEAGTGLKGDWGNIFVLTFLYVLQGIPLGLAGAIPMILQNHSVTYKDQAVFSFVHWPFSLKLLWAPIVDSVYSSRVGRRKSWLVPTQYLIGAFLLGLSFTIDSLFGLGEGTDKKPDVILITSVFFILCFLAATQDIAVDGWALTMLAKHNVGHASTCNCIGQSAGYFIGFVIFLALESAEFCNNYLRSDPLPVGMITLPGFLYFWGFVYFITTTLVWILKREKRSDTLTREMALEQNVGEAYVSLWRILQLPSIRLLIIFLLTMKISFAAPDAISGLKLAEKGVPKERLAFLAIPLIPLQIFLPIYISRFTAGPRPLDVLIKAYPFRLLFGFIYPVLVWATPFAQIKPGEFSFQYYAIVLACYCVHQVAVYSTFVSIMGFFSQISDPIMGGTYMTLLNTLSNLGGNWPATVSLWLVDSLTYKSCIGGNVTISCDNEDSVQSCDIGGGTCEKIIDGYYVECAIGTVIGIFWFFWGRRAVAKMQSVHESAWRFATSINLHKS